MYVRIIQLVKKTLNESFLINGGKMIKSKGWDWKIVKDDIDCPWKIPSVESYYLLNRWENLNFKNFLERIALRMVINHLRQSSEFFSLAQEPC